MLYKHKGYTLTQGKSNYHYTIFDKYGHMVMHVEYMKLLTAEKARECIEYYLLFSEKQKKKGNARVVINQKLNKLIERIKGSEEL